MKRMLTGFICLSAFTGVAFVSPVFSYDPPVGIKDPGMWGTNHPIDTVAPSTATKCPNWPSSETTSCYYVDSTDGSCSDGNTYGYPNVPLCSLPRTYSAGSYVEIHGGPYSESNYPIYQFNGTEANPIWFRGESSSNMGEIKDSIKWKGSYVFVENIKFTPGSDHKFDSYIGSLTPTAENHHFVFRHCEIAGDGIEMTTVSASNFFPRGSAVYNTHDIVWYDNNFHDIGDWQSTNTCCDALAIHPGEYSYNLWVLENEISYFQGDAMQIGSNAYTDAMHPHHLWIGGNSMHHHRENSIDVKHAHDVILASNDFYGIRDSNTSEGYAVVVHWQDDNEAPYDIWIVNNNIYDSTNGIQVKRSEDVYVIGNLIYDINAESPIDGGPASHGVAVSVNNNSGLTINTVIVGNTIDDYGMGVSVQQGSQSQEVTVYNNIFSNRNESLGRDIYFEDAYPWGSPFYSNLFSTSGGQRFRVGSNSYTDVASFAADLTDSSSNQENDPLFVSTGTNYGLQDSSPAIDTGYISGVYDTFYTKYGVSIKIDLNEVARPSNGIWDRGAYEYNDSPDLPGIAAPAAFSLDAE